MADGVAMGAQTKGEAQQRVDEIRTFQRELGRLSEAGILALSPAQSEAIRAHHDALLAGYDGLSDIRQIITQARSILRDQGRLLFEHGHDQGAAVRALLEAAGFEQIETRLDYAGHERNTLGVLATQQKV